MEEKLPELSISCPVCNDREHKMTIFFNELHPEKCYIKCRNCNSMFRLVGTRVEISAKAVSAKTA